MKAHDRLWKALCHEEADRVPTFSQSIEPGFIRAYDETIEMKDSYGLPEVGLSLAKEMGFDSKWLHMGSLHRAPKDRPKIPPELLPDPNLYSIGDTGQVYARNSRGESWYAGGILKTPELLRAWIDYVKAYEYVGDGIYKQFAQTWQHGCEIDCVPIPTVGGPIYTGWSTIGMDRIAFFMRKYPELVTGWFGALTDQTLADHSHLFEHGVDMVFICDDHAQKDRGFFSPAQFERFIEPQYKKLAVNTHKHGAKLLLHTDGYLHEEMPHLVRAGVDAAEPLEYEAGNRLAFLKEHYGDALTFIGNVPASDVLCFGTVEDTMRTTKQCILDAGAGGGFILSPGANILNTAKIANVQAMLATVKEYGCYPLDVRRLKQ